MRRQCTAPLCFLLRFLRIGWCADRPCLPSYQKVLRSRRPGDRQRELIATLSYLHDATQWAG